MINSDSFGSITFPEANTAIDRLLIVEALWAGSSGRVIDSAICDLSNLSLCEPKIASIDWTHEAEKIDATHKNLDRSQRVDLLCQILLRKAKYSSDTYPETASSISKAITQITGCKDLIEAQKAFPQAKSLSKLSKILSFPELAEAKSKNCWDAKLENEGLSGTYLMPSRRGDFVGVFKPEIEGYGSVGNPKGWTSVKNHPFPLESGPSYSLREALAYEFNRGFANVPKTTLTKLRKSLKSAKEVGSFQVFIKNAKAVSQISNVEFGNTVSKRDVQRLAIQDIRWLNPDRHENNLLCDSHNTLFLIDHGRIFPPTATRLVFAWINYPQSARSLDEEERAYIANIDPEKDEYLLRKCGLTCSDAITRMKIAALFLKRCVAENLTLQEIGHLMISGPGVRYSSPSMCKVLKDSYFEMKICMPILQGGDPQHEFECHIKRFRSFDWHLSFFRISPELQYTKVVIEDGLDLISIKGNSKTAGSQSIRIVSIAKRILLTGEYTLEPIITTPFTHTSSMLTVSQMAEKIPEAAAIINGGYFHYESPQNAGYEWNGFFRRGDPIGSCFGSFRDGIRGEPNSNPLWGTLAINKSNVKIIKKTPYTFEHSLCEIDSAPVLMQNKVLSPLDIQTKVDPPNPAKPNIPPGDFQKHINSRVPRSVVALTDDAVLFITIDGKQSNATGMTGKELGAFLQSYPEITDALNLDGGGSTTMWVKGKGIVNTPSDKTERRVSTVIALLKQKPL